MNQRVIVERVTGLEFCGVLDLGGDRPPLPWVADLSDPARTQLDLFPDSSLPANWVDAQRGPWATEIVSHLIDTYQLPRSRTLRVQPSQDRDSA